MAKFHCCTLQAKKEGGGEPIWINIDLVAAIQVDQFGLGSKITLTGENAPQFYVAEKPHEILERVEREARKLKKD